MAQQKFWKTFHGPSIDAWNISWPPQKPSGLPSYILNVWSLMKKWKEKSSNAACAVLYKAYRQIHISKAQFACIPSKD